MQSDSRPAQCSSPRVGVCHYLSRFCRNDSITRDFAGDSWQPGRADLAAQQLSSSDLDCSALGERQVLVGIERLPSRLATEQRLPSSKTSTRLAYQGDEFSRQNSRAIESFRKKRDTQWHTSIAGVELCAGPQALCQPWAELNLPPIHGPARRRSLSEQLIIVMTGRGRT